MPLKEEFIAHGSPEEGHTGKHRSRPGGRGRRRDDLGHFPFGGFQGKGKAGQSKQLSQRTGCVIPVSPGL